MLVGDRMAHPVITIPPEMQVIDALNLMKNKKIRRTPVVQDGVLVGIISDKDMLNASPASTTSLSVWEINYLLSKITVRDVMTRNVLTVTENTPIEEAARIMADNKIGGLPVVRGDQIVGIITETDLFKIFLELMGAREAGVRVTAMISDEKGTLARLTQAIAAAGGNFIAFGQFTGEKPDTRLVTFKESEIPQEELEKIISPFVDEIFDIRTSHL
jgi:acetoin utilization protein AcuB